MYYIDQIKDRQKYINAIILAFIVVFVIFMLGLLGPVGTVKVDVYEGSIVSADGVVLTEIQNKDSEVAYTAHAASLTYPKEYSALIGYNTSTRFNSDLRARYEDYLYDGKIGETGKTLTLTVNHKLQQHCYEILSKYKYSGSIVVLNTQTGAVEALVSRKAGVTYDANRIDEKYDEWEKANNSFLLPEWRISRCPGSTFKIVSGLGILKSGNKKYKYDDTTGYIEIGDKKISNANGAVFGKMDLKEALKNSANVYFVKLYNEEVELEYLNEAAKNFFIGESISTDFGVLQSNWEIDESNPYNIAQTVFGQGKTEITPVHGAMIIASVANGGKLLRPYIVSTVFDESLGDKIEGFFKKGDKKTEVLSRSISRSDAKEMKKMLSYNAEYYGLGENYYAKSGTAELDNKGNIQTWILAANDRHAVAISIRNAGFGMYLAPNAKSVLDTADSLIKTED